MISLIVNADDLGINEYRDRGILEAFERGIVTSTSMLANGPSFASAAIRCKALGMPVGVHLNLSEGTTLTGPIDGLTDACARLPGKQALRRYLNGEDWDAPGILRELRAQVERLLEAGLRPDHLDGHQHCHLYPRMTALVTGLAAEYGIPAMRNAWPAEPDEDDPTGELGSELDLYRQLARQTRQMISDAGLSLPHGLWGTPLLDRLDTSRLCALLEQLPQGFWELMTHPGYPYPPGSPFDGPLRLQELKALCSLEASEIILRRRIRLCNFGDLPCAS
jgi:predicted glycoside hydrolase/deacetylase ChbG (UPF0249 family)